MGWTLARAAQIWHSNATKTSSENCTGILHSATRDLARALSPPSRGCWRSAHDPRLLFPVPLAACGKARLKCRLTDISGARFFVLGLFACHFGRWGVLDLT